MRSCLLTLAFALTWMLAACSAPVPTPTVESVAVVPTATPSPIPAPVDTATPQLVIGLITPTLAPTQLPSTQTPTTTVGIATPLPTALPELGTSAADAGLVAILQRCWQVSDPRQMNGNLPAHRDAFDCGRAALLELAKNNPNYALVHRVLAWGYFYKDSNAAQAVAEYRIAANLYHKAGDRIGESEARMRLGLLLVASSRTQACSELAQAGTLYPGNDRASFYYDSYNCSRPTAGGAPSGGNATAQPSPPPPSITLDQVRGKILFKSDRGPELYYMMDPDGGNVKPASAAAYNAAAKWESFSPDHQQVATVRLEGSTTKFGYNNDLWITDPQGGNGRALANPANDYDPVWSPLPLYDGQNWIAFVSNRGDIKHSEFQGEEIWLTHPDGTPSVRLTCHGPNYSKHPSWSGDAKQLVFYSNYPGAGNSQIFVIDLAGLGSAGDTCSVGDSIRNLSNNSFNDSDPIWVK